MQNILNTNDDEKYFRNIANKPIKFLNEDSDDESSSDSSDDSDEKNSKTLWIERYRQQKMKNLNKIVKQIKIILFEIELIFNLNFEQNFMCNNFINK